MNKYLVMLTGLSLLLAGCGAANSDDEYTDDFLSLDGNNFVMEVDRILEMSDAQLPMDDLQESYYVDVNEGSQYIVTFSEDGQTVTIAPGSISGQKRNDDGESRIYELDKGVFAGGRFVIWGNDDLIEVELTIYGSGIPIVKSERGYLVPEQ